MSGRSSRNKGRAFEQRVARDLREIFPDAKRGFQTRGGTAEEADIEGTPYHIECKAHKKCDRRSAWEQAYFAESHKPAADCKYRTPVAVCKDDRLPPTVTMTVTALLDLYESGGHAFLVHMDYEDWLAQLKVRHGSKAT